MPAATHAVVLQATNDSLVVEMPTARNGWITALGFGVGVPWVILSVAGTVAAIVLAPPELRRNVVLGSFIIHVLLVMIHVLALAMIWLAVYGRSGTETLSISPMQVILRRKAMGITIPIKTGRTTYDKVEVLDTSLTPGKTPHPRIEIRSGHSALRFGAGISAAAAEELRLRIRDVLRGIGRPA